MDSRIEFLYLNEPDTINAGVNDAGRCVDVCEEIFGLLAQGDYLMGGNNHNSHGMGIIFPKETKFPNMPVAGPDRRFFAMPAYLGGRFDCCGNKWYGSNAANKDKKLPRSILTMMLNDKDTGAPLCLMSANLLSAARTGAVPAVAVRHLARSNAKVIAVLGCGPINKSCFLHIMTQCKDIEKVYFYDLFKDKAIKLARWASEDYGVDGIAVDDLEKILRESDIVTIAASRIKPLLIKSEWVKPGSVVLLTGPVQGDEAFWTKNRIVFDHIQLQSCYMEEATASNDKQAYYNGVIGGPIYRLIDEGKLPTLTDSASIGQIVTGERQGRKDEKEIFIFVACGMAVFDVGWGYEVYKTALEKGIGQKLLLWDVPTL